MYYNNTNYFGDLTHNIVVAIFNCLFKQNELQLAGTLVPGNRGQYLNICFFYFSLAVSRSCGEGSGLSRIKI